MLKRVEETANAGVVLPLRVPRSKFQT